MSPKPRVRPDSWIRSFFGSAQPDFDEWLAHRDRLVRAEALRAAGEAWDRAEGFLLGSWPPSPSDWLRERAERGHGDA